MGAQIQENNSENENYLLKWNCCSDEVKQNIKVSVVTVYNSPIFKAET